MPHICAICSAEYEPSAMRMITNGQLYVCRSCAGPLVSVFIDGEPRHAPGGALLRRLNSSPTDPCDMCKQRDVGQLTGYESFAACRRDISIIADAFLRPDEPAPGSYGEDERVPMADTPVPEGFIRCWRCHTLVDTDGRKVAEGHQSLEVDTANGPDLFDFYVITADGAVLHKCFSGRSGRIRYWERLRDETGSSPRHRQIFAP